MIRTILLTAWFLVILLFKIHSRISFILGILLLVLSSIMILLNHQGFALRLTTDAFGVFVVGCIMYIKEVRENEK